MLLLNGEIKWKTKISLTFFTLLSISQELIRARSNCLALNTKETIKSTYIFFQIFKNFIFWDIASETLNRVTVTFHLSQKKFLNIVLKLFAIPVKWDQFRSFTLKTFENTSNIGRPLMCVFNKISSFWSAIFPEPQKLNT